MQWSTSFVGKLRNSQTYQHRYIREEKLRPQYFFSCFSPLFLSLELIWHSIFLSRRSYCTFSFRFHKRTRIFFYLCLVVKMALISNIGIVSQIMGVKLKVQNHFLIDRSIVTRICKKKKEKEELMTKWYIYGMIPATVFLKILPTHCIYKRDLTPVLLD